ncbi:hypothetical protein BASA60_005374 [Batrachochytrium salamandrivorans]|nr:hypothetical protein BASA60_005374 [Batrachochytrium salamandrivorans]
MWIDTADSCSTVPSNQRWSRSASPFKTPPQSQDVRMTKWSATAVCLSTRGEVSSARAGALHTKWSIDE